MDIAAGARTREARSRGRRHVLGLAGAVACLLLAGATGCGGDGIGDGSPGATGTTASTATPDGGEPNCEDGTLDGRRYVLCATAGMALRYTSEHPDQVRAVVSVAGQLPRDPAVRPSGRVPLLEVYGTADPLRPYDVGVRETPGRGPGDPTPTVPTRDTVAAFVAVGLGASEHEVLVDADLDPTDGTSVRTERWTDRGGTLAVLRSILGGGHTWPSSRGQFTGGEKFGVTSGEVDASAEAIAFVVDPEGGFPATTR